MSKTNIKMGHPSYIIKEKEGIIICKITSRGRDNIDSINICNYNYLLKKYFNIPFIGMPKTFIGISKCNKNDKWDEIVGKRIAESKCKRKIYNYYYRLCSCILNKLLSDDIHRFRYYTDNLAYCSQRESEHLKELMNNENKS